ncbi:SDR family oxidoreductase [Prochlorococcus marinus]|uniref:Short-chain dehydrogenase n=1 Tax=Prochlorococcus marinus XMU1408 TaxID=2213228 RepID=A0A318R9N9_PROMR|nr:SDR family oxidoreductase [Prochlorococcus marinus]MBW3041562.1 short-chain dehydrogenase [Prochlorococcus marinus str. XMU1408]PYE02719.1 short-chain dehydrogenase [Prochlorococcus marinus XMU1408]
MPTVLITGASRGIGRATAKAFANDGWDLLLISRSEEDLVSLVNEVDNKKIKSYYKCIDLSNSKDISKGINELLKNGLVPSVVINNAGVAWTGDLLSMPIEKWEWIMQLNLTSIFQICSEVVPLMRNKGGLIINVSSHASRNAFSQWGAYCVSKAALASFTKCLAEEERKHCIRACTLTLGSVNSSLWDTDTVEMQFDKDSMLTVDQVAYELLHIANQPSNQIIEDLTLMPSGGVF